jgi:hypothetical protein
VPQLLSPLLLLLFQLVVFVEMNTQKDFLIQQIKELLTDKETSIHNLRLFLQNSIVTTIESWEEGALGHWMNIGKPKAPSSQDSIVVTMLFCKNNLKL